MFVIIILTFFGFKATQKYNDILEKRNLFEFNFVKKKNPFIFAQWRRFHLFTYTLFST